MSFQENPPEDAMSAHKPRYIVSACLCGICCRYDGTAFAIDRFMRMAENGLALPVCPELLGGLPTPRPPCELLGDRVFDKDGLDMTNAFLKGAHRTLELALQHQIRLAIFKERSPSCGCNMIFDGRFKGSLIPGQGVTTALLRQYGITVFNEETVPQYL